MVDIPSVKILLQKHQRELQTSIGVCIMHQTAEFDKLLEEQSSLARRASNCEFKPAATAASPDYDRLRNGGNGAQCGTFEVSLTFPAVQDDGKDSTEDASKLPNVQMMTKAGIAPHVVVGQASEDNEVLPLKETRGSTSPSTLITDDAIVATLSSKSNGKKASLRNSGYIASEESIPCFQRFVESPLFEFGMGFVIVTNSAFIGLQVEHAASDLAFAPPDIFILIANIYAFLFTLELALRIAAYRKAFFDPFGASASWNYLDILIVSTTLWEVGMDVYFRLNKDAVEDGNLQSSNLRIVRILRIARFLRVIRIAKILRFVHALRTFIYSIIATLKSLVWALVLMFMIFYVFAIIFTQTVTDYVVDVGANEADIGESNHGETLKYWGSLTKSMLTLFKSISGGLSWHDCLSPLQTVGGVWVACFLGYLAFTYFAVLNVVTGIFCQSAIDTAQNNEDLIIQTLIVEQSHFAERMERLFKTFDKDNSGTISRWEFEQHMEEPSVIAFFESLQVDAVDACLLFKIMDADGGDGMVDFDEFVGGLMRLKGNAKRADFLILENKMTNLMNAKHKDLLSGLRSLGQGMVEVIAFLKKSAVVEAYEARTPIRVESKEAEHFGIPEVEPATVNL